MPVAAVQRSAEARPAAAAARSRTPVRGARPGDEPPDGAVLACGGAGTAPAPGWHVLDLDAPAQHHAQRCWRQALRSAAIRANAGDVADLAGRMPMAESSIGGIVDKAVTSARAQGRATDAGRCQRDARARIRATTSPGWPAGCRLRSGWMTSCCPIARATGWTRCRPCPATRIAASADLGLTGVRGRAVIALFHGPSGTGKTAAAEAVAADLDRDLWVVDLAQVVSKWLGETQRNLDAVLAEAAAAGAVLLFDEADGLFGKRGEVTDARDRYANLEIDHLLQRIELHTGVVVLTSNRPGGAGRGVRPAASGCPSASTCPTTPEREELWRRVLPAALLAQGADTGRRAREDCPAPRSAPPPWPRRCSRPADGTRGDRRPPGPRVSRELEKTAADQLTARRSAMTQHRPDLSVTVDAMPEPGLIRPAIEAALGRPAAWPPGPEASDRAVPSPRRAAAEPTPGDGTARPRMMLMRGMLLSFSDPVAGMVPTLVPFQYNPAEVTRVLRVSPGQRRAAPACGCGAPPTETYTLKIELDALDALDKPITGALGVGPLLAAIEAMLEPGGGGSRRAGSALPVAVSARRRRAARRRCRHRRCRSSSSPGAPSGSCRCGSTPTPPTRPASTRAAAGPGHRRPVGHRAARPRPQRRP